MAPYGTLRTSHQLGSPLSVGCIAGYFVVRGHSSQSLQLFLTTGILGGFTTFSACIAFVIASVLLSIGGVFAGLALARLPLN